MQRDSPRVHNWKEWIVVLKERKDAKLERESLIDSVVEEDDQLETWHSLLR